MPVLVEAISVLLKIASIRSRLSGGWDAFVERVPNATLCYDENLARVGFLDEEPALRYLSSLENAGLALHRDWGIATQWQGVTSGTGWIQTHTCSVDGKGEVRIAWLHEGSRPFGSGWSYFRRGQMDSWAAPSGWTYEGSCSEVEGLDAPRSASWVERNVNPKP